MSIWRTKKMRVDIGDGDGAFGGIDEKEVEGNSE